MPNPPRPPAHFSLADHMVGIALFSLVLALVLEASLFTLLFSLPFLATTLITRAGGDGLKAAPVVGLLVWVIPYVGVVVWLAFEMNGIDGSVFLFVLFGLLAISIGGLLAGWICGGLGYVLGVVWRRIVVGPEFSSPETGAARAPTPPRLTPPPPRTSNAPPSPPVPPA
jgi:hypothetical protein